MFISIKLYNRMIIFSINVINNYLSYKNEFRWYFSFNLDLDDVL